MPQPIKHCNRSNAEGVPCSSGKQLTLSCNNTSIQAASRHSLSILMMKKSFTIVVAIIIQCVAPGLVFPQSLMHNVEGRHAITAGGYYSYFQPGSKGKLLAPFFAYQHNVRLDKYHSDKNKILLQLGASFSPTNTLDDNVDSSKYVLTLPGYANPFASLYTVQEIGKAGFLIHAGASNGFKTLPFNKITTNASNNTNETNDRLGFANNTLLQYYFGFGGGISFKRYLDLHVQYNRIYHDLFDETREKFRAEYSNEPFHGSYFDVSLRVHPFTNKQNTFTTYVEFEWRGLGRAYEYKKAAALGIGLLFTPWQLTQNEKEKNKIVSKMEVFRSQRPIQKQLLEISKAVEDLEQKLTSSPADQAIRNKLQTVKLELQKMRDDLKKNEAISAIETKMEALKKYASQTSLDEINRDIKALEQKLTSSLTDQAIRNEIRTFKLELQKMQKDFNK